MTLKKTKIYKNLYEIITNDKQRILVKSTPDELEKAFQEGKIWEWSGLEIYKPDFTK